MGSDAVFFDIKAIWGPAHHVAVSGFYMAAYEVTKGLSKNSPKRKGSKRKILPRKKLSIELGPERSFSPLFRRLAHRSVLLQLALSGRKVDLSSTNGSGMGVRRQSRYDNSLLVER